MQNSKCKTQNAKLKMQNRRHCVLGAWSVNLARIDLETQRLHPRCHGLGHKLITLRAGMHQVGQEERLVERSVSVQEVVAEIEEPDVLTVGERRKKLVGGENFLAKRHACGELSAGQYRQQQD